MADKPLDPQKVMCVVKNKDGKEVGRVAASAPHASRYLEGLAQTYGEITVDYVEDADAAMISRMLAPR